jgi:septal ring factor EnvC (AmiA/AmiB activator)
MTTQNKAIRVGVKQVISSVTRIDETTIREGIVTLENKGSSRAPMYDIDQVKDKFSLTTDEYNTLLVLATKPRAPRTPKSGTTANTELLTLATDLAAKSSKIDSINSEITKLTNERDTLQNEVNAILSQLKLK